MKVNYKPDHDISAVQSATGKTLEDWFADLDAKGGVAQGRKGLSDYLFKEKKVDAWWTTTLVVEFEKTRGAVEKDGHAKGYNICVTKSLAAPPAKVYDALLDMKAWLGSKATVHASEGGAFDDGEGHHGIFKRLAPGKTIRFTWIGKGHQPVEDVEIKLAAAGAKTSLVLNHNRLPDRAAADGMRAAWASVLESIKQRVT